MNNWVKEESQGTYFGDKRLNKRYTKILEKLFKESQESIPSSLKTWKETNAAYRFLHNDNVTPEKVLQGHQQSTKERLHKVSRVLLIQDGTSLDYTTNRSGKNLSHIENKYHRGLILHPTMAVSMDRINLGIANFDMWSRDLSSQGKKYKRKQLPIEEKESRYWLKGYEQANKIAKENPGTEIISVGDREYDIYEVLESSRREESRSKIVIRAAQNRRLALENEETKLLWQALENSEKLSEKEVLLPKRNSKEDEIIKFEIRAKEVTFKPPYRKDRKLEEVRINALLISEDKEKSEGKEWLLLTTLPIGSKKELDEIVEIYAIRWQIEIYFRILKGGCKIEQIQLEDKESLSNAIAVYMVIAWRIQYMLMLGRQVPEIPADVVFSDSEWKSYYVINEKKIPDEIPKLNELVRGIAQMGGFIPIKGRNPGVKTFWSGFVKMMHYAEMYDVMINYKSCV